MSQEKENEPHPSYASLRADTDRRLSVTISDGMYRELTLRKLDEGRSYNAIVIDALKAYLSGR